MKEELKLVLCADIPAKNISFELLKLDAFISTAEFTDTGKLPITFFRSKRVFDATIKKREVLVTHGYVELDKCNNYKIIGTGEVV